MKPIPAPTLEELEARAKLVKAHRKLRAVERALAECAGGDDAVMLRCDLNSEERVVHDRMRELMGAIRETDENQQG